ncbi:MAG: ABC transporter ATP-binding protein [Parvularculaceae bacterium]
MARRLWRDYLSRYRPKLALALLAMAAYAASASAIPRGVEWINAALGDGGARLGLVAVVGPLLIVGLGAVNAAALFAQARLSASAALSALRDLQRDLYAKLLAVDDAQLRAVGSGPAAARLTNDVLVLRETLARAANAVRDLMTLVGLCAVMIHYDWLLFVVVLIVYPALGWPVARIGRYLRRGSREAQGQAGDIAALAGEAVSGGRLIRAYGLQADLQARADARFEERLAVLDRMARLRALNEPFVFLVGSIALAVVVAIVAIRIEAGALDVAQFVSFIIALLLMSQPARGLSTLNAVAQEGFGAFERMLDLLDAEPTVVDRPDAGDLKAASGAVSFRNVAFSYDGAGPALDGFSLDVPGGATVALVGASGAGKSTVFNLLLRLYEPSAGEILVDGQAIEGVSLASLRSRIAVVSQEAVLFDDTIAANIAYGKPGATRAEIERAAADAALAVPLSRGGLDAQVGEAGGALSGGERQRVAIARAFLRDAPNLLLDEATAALDAATETAIQAAVARLTKGRTTIVIAHRLSTVRGADMIAVMDRGRIVETGTHDDLLAQNGAYARLAALQFADAATPAAKSAR